MRAGGAGHEASSARRRRRWWVLPLAWASAILGGCGDDTRPAVWEYISPAILEPNCATVSCHSRAAAVAGLDLSDPDRGYVSLTRLRVWIVAGEGSAGAAGCMRVEGVVVCERPHRPLVNAFNPGQSRVVHLLRARGAARMPPDRPLPEGDIRLIERWILDGASKTVGGAPAGGGVDAGGDPTRGDGGPG